jgi:D-alanyl-D-alanine-carboxypeptidase/D-alanyl-D-alanine-endopeptidase
MNPRIQPGWSRRVMRIIFSLISVFPCLMYCASSATALTDDDIKTMLRDSIEIDRQNVGLAVGIVDEHGAHVICHGKLDNNTDRDVDGDTLFAIGSITKVFTALLLQDMIERGEMKLDDPVQKYLPDSAKLPTFQGKEITLLHLATHTSALPRDSSGDLYPFLSGCKLQRAPGTRKEYSNLGVGLLGHVIARKAGKDYETLVAERICRPLGMNDTCITVPPDLKARCAAGHAMPGHRVGDFSPTRHDTNALAPTLHGAGSIKSTANDLLRFVSAYAGLTPSPLSSVMRNAMESHLLESGDRRPLVWENAGEVFEHGGLLEGYQAELAFDVKKRRGIVVLSNCANVGSLVPGIWKGLLEGCSPRPAHTVPVNQTLYDDYAGLYKFEDGDLFTARHQGNRLILQVLGKPGQRWRYVSYEVFPQSQEVFCNEFWQVQARFIPATAGQPPQLVLAGLGPTAGTNSYRSVRISKEIPPVPIAIRADPAIYDGYVGRYRKTFLFRLIRVGPTLRITHKQDELGSHLVASVPGTGTEEFFPMSENHFIVGFNVSDDLRLTFVRNKKGKTTGVNVLWNGKKYSGSRISKEST